MTDANTLKSIGLRFLRLTAVLFAYGLVISSFLIFGPHLEGKFFPVIKDVNVSFTSQNVEPFRLIFDGTKVRDCTFLAVSALPTINNKFIRADNEFADIGDGSTHTRPKGRQTFGPWIITPSGDEVILAVFHKCHPLWNTVTPLVYWKSPL